MRRDGRHVKGQTWRGVGWGEWVMVGENESWEEMQVCMQTEHTHTHAHFNNLHLNITLSGT